MMEARRWKRCCSDLVRVFCKNSQWLEVQERFLRWLAGAVAQFGGMVQVRTVVSQLQVKARTHVDVGIGASFLARGG